MTEKKLTIREDGTLRELDVKAGDVVELLERPARTGRWALPDVGYTCAIAEDGSLYGIGAEYLHELTCRFRLISRAKTAATDAATIQRVMEASSPSVDLTTLTSPFGLLPPETQAALKAHDGPVEFYISRGGWMGVAGDPFWDCATTYRAAPQPKVETHTVDGATYFTHDDTPQAIYVTITYTTTNGVIDPASYRVEARG